jgi:apolipoprotein N-acyltransferase
MSSEEATVRKSVFFLLAVASSFLVSISFPPTDAGFCAWFGLAPLLFAMRQRGFLSASILGFLFGSFFSVGAFFWTFKIDVVYLSDFLVFLIIFSLYYLAFGFLYRLISKNVGLWTLVGAPSLWVTLEYIRANLFFLSWPWNLLGHSQHTYLSVIQIADTTGVYGISFALVMVNQFLSQAPDFLKVRKKSADKRLVVQLLIVIVAVTCTFSYGWYRLSMPDSSKRVRVALVQGNLVVPEGGMRLSQQKQHMARYTELTRDAARYSPNLILWPASSLPGTLAASYVRSPILQLAQEINSYILVGGSGQAKDIPKRDLLPRYANSEFLISPAGMIVGKYNKILLTPFNEYVPLKDIVRWPSWITSAKQNFTPGKEFTIFHLPDANFGTLICWENLFTDQYRRFVTKGAEFMVMATNEAFFGSGNSAGPYQSLAINVFRAVENRVAIARAAATGVSCFISPHGEILDRVKDSNGKDLSVSGILVREIPLSDNKTFYTLYGDIFAYIVIGITAFFILIGVRRSKRIINGQQ